MNQFPQKVGLHVLGGTGPDLDFRHRYKDLVTNDLYLAGIGFGRNSLESTRENLFSVLMNARARYERDGPR